MKVCLGGLSFQSVSTPFIANCCVVNREVSDQASSVVISTVTSVLEALLYSNVTVVNHKDVL